ncbi:two-component system regulatory protein YycI [Metabacillus iocasae]|uniref:Regulatory protein YycI of two-component signal transduction system YycFG n=1 Tax=Priestia iocasae TaxID=2291674 RepID=A0ABS2QXJ4_9BACI|nr:two-component system regulatory protein YycI [Metabacillus iocasae]MBM7704196.1 regulatory protein YycI of two-component signal transduction system YycFG [Metabacillus iocasae]
MDWNKTKTVFIITFLILDLFLAYQFMVKKNQNDLDFITEASVEEQLAQENITYEELPKSVEKKTYLNARSLNFIEEDLTKLKGQKIEFLSDYEIQGVFEEPIPLPSNNTSFRLNQFLKEYIFAGSSYALWHVNKEANVIIFYQKHADKLIYDNTNAMLIVHLNDKNEMVSYEQKLLKDIEKMDDDQEILTPIKALENLFFKDELKPGSKITKVSLGYYTFDLPVSSSQVLVPTWHIIVNEEEHYFVNAFEGQILSKRTN